MVCITFCEDRFTDFFVSFLFAFTIFQFIGAWYKILHVKHNPFTRQSPFTRQLNDFCGNNL